jgi:hypothetical protein
LDSIFKLIGGIGIAIDLGEESVGARRRLTVILHQGLLLHLSGIPEKASIKMIFASEIISV